MAFARSVRSSRLDHHDRPGALRALAISAVAAAGLLACGQVTVVDDGAPPAACEDDTPTRPTEPPKPVALRDPRSGVFVGDHLHLEADVNGEARYVVLAVESSELAWAVAAPQEMNGPANLEPIAPDTYARVRAATPGALFVDVVDTSRPAAPAIVARMEFAGEIDAPSAPVFSAMQERLFFCMLPAADDAERQLVAVDLSDPAQPGEPQSLGSEMCNRYPDGGVAADGAVWMVWGKESDLDLYAVAPDGATHIADYYYVPDGVHAYGAVLGASSDGARAVLDPANDSEFFLFEVPGPTPSGAVAHAYLGVGGPKRLLGVVDGIAYLATPAGLRAYDVTDVAQPELLGYEADVAFGDGLARLVAASARYLAVVDAQGTLYLAPRDVSGPVAPLEVYKAPAAGTTPAPCGGAGTRE